MSKTNPHELCDATVARLREKLRDVRKVRDALKRQVGELGAELKLLEPAESKAERIEQLECEVGRLLKHAENARSAMMFKVEAERTAALSEGYDLIRTMGGRQPCSQCSGTGTRVYVMDSLERCKDCGGNGYTNVRE